MNILSSAYVLRKCQICGEEQKPHTIRTRTQLPLPACVDCMENLPPIPQGKKRCPQCLAVFEESRTRWGTRTYCKKCTSEQRKARHTLEAGRAWALRYHYDISAEEYDLMFFQQAGVCAVCGNPETTYDKRVKKVRSLAVDHDHENNYVRGLLCSGCNSLLASIENEPERFKALKKYMKRHGIEH